MIRSILMIVGLLMGISNLPLVYLAISSYYIFVRITMSQRADMEKGIYTSFSNKIVYIDYALLLFPIIIYHLHPNTNKKVLLFLWYYIAGWLSIFFH